jgi:hypothetical protein
MPSKNRPPRLNPFKDRSPVQRMHAAEYLLITLISFGFSVSATRLFLEITGFPQLGKGEIHIAHVLWGGLFLFIASLLPLINVNRWNLRLSALLAGFGIGLFIDEVGKFITQTNDYFYPAAAPIVYVFFLMTLLLFAHLRNNRKSSVRMDMYHILEDFEEVLDEDLSADEYQDLNDRLDLVIQKEKPAALIDLARHLLTYLEMNRSRVVPDDPDIYDRLKILTRRFERSYLGQDRLRKILKIGLLALGIWELVSPIGFRLMSRDAAQLQLFLDQLISDRLVRSAGGLNWFEARVLLEGGVGILALAAFILLMLKAEKAGIWLGLIVLLITLTVVNPLVFYFDQFSSLIAAMFHFILFVLLLRYKQRFSAQEK